MARGAWTLFLGADDRLWDSQVLEDTATVLESLPSDTRVAYGLVNVLSADDRLLFTWGGAWESVARRLRYGMSIPHTGTFHHRDLFAMRGNFDETFTIAGDFEFLLRELSHRPAAYLGNRTITAMATGGKGSNPETQRVRIRESVEARRRHAMLPGPSAVPSVVYELEHLVRERYPRLHRRAMWPVRTSMRILKRLKKGLPNHGGRSANPEDGGRIMGIRTQVNVPRISIVVATLNGAGVLERCIDSIVAQDSQNWELIVVDGGSTDGTVDLLRNKAHVITKWISEKDNGIYDAWNKALPEVTGDWLLFLGADDYLWDASAIRRAAALLKDVPVACRVAYGRATWVMADGRVVGGQGAPWGQCERAFRRYMAIPHQATFHRTELFRVRGGFDASFRISGDYEFLLRELEEHAPTFLPGLTVAAMQKGGLNEQQRLRRDIETLRARHRHGRFANYAWLHPTLLPPLFWMYAVLEGAWTGARQLLTRTP